MRRLSNAVTLTCWRSHDIALRWAICWNVDALNKCCWTHSMRNVFKPFLTNHIQTSVKKIVLCQSSGKNAGLMILWTTSTSALRSSPFWMLMQSRGSLKTAIKNIAKENLNGQNCDKNFQSKLKLNVSTAKKNDMKKWWATLFKTIHFHQSDFSLHTTKQNWPRSWIWLWWPQTTNTKWFGRQPNWPNKSFCAWTSRRQNFWWWRWKSWWWWRSTSRWRWG